MKTKITELIKGGKKPGAEGLLDEYMAQKINSYQEPERKGTPRGDKIGFPLNKYISCLLVALTNYSLKRIADIYGSDLGFSYGLLRKWNTESDFKAKQVGFRREFAWKIFNYIQSEFKRAWENHNDYYDARTNKKPDAVNFETISRNAKIFNASCLHELEKINVGHFNKVEGLKENNKITDNTYTVELTQYFAISGFIINALGRKNSYREFLEAKDKEFLQFLICDSINLLSKKRNLSIKDQRKLIDTLELLMHFISRR